MPAPIELNNPALYDVSEIAQLMSRASTIDFSVIANAFDADPLPARTLVRFTVTRADLTTVVLFEGRTLPIGRNLGAGSERVQYRAADIHEYLGTNPCAGANDWYNRETNNAGVYPYPDGYTVEQIITAEFAGILGHGLLIEALDFTALGAVKDTVLREFEAKGKTFLGLLQAIAGELAVMGWWFDPSDIDDGAGVSGTLRFYDTGAASSGPKTLVLPFAGATGANAERVVISEDISGCYDKLTLHGWGIFQERREALTPAWGTDIGDFEKILRIDETNGHTQVYGSSFTDVVDTAAGAAWHPGSSRKQAQYAYRRYQAAHEVADLKLTLDSSVSPARLIRGSQALSVEVPKYLWDVGNLSSTGADGTIYMGSLNYRSGIKEAAFTGSGDFGTLTAITPAVADPVGPPQAFEKQYVLLAEHAVYKRQFLFTNNTSGDSTFDALVGKTVFMYTGIGDTVWLTYTGRDDLATEVTDGSLGLSKHLELYDVRFIKYTNIHGSTLRDDSAELAAYAAAIFSILKRPRVNGSALAHAEPVDAADAWPMGCFIRLENWKYIPGTIVGGIPQPGIYDVPARVQGRRFQNPMQDARCSLDFDREHTFTYVSLLRRFKAYFEHHIITGEVGGQKGPAGQAVPGHVITHRDHQPAGTALRPLNPPVQWAQAPSAPASAVKNSLLVQGKITVQAGGSAAAIPSTFTYRAASLDGSIVTQPGQRPLYQPYNNEANVIPAPVDSECVLWLVPGGSGYTAKILQCREEINFEVCTSSASFVFRAGDGALDIGNAVVASDGTPVISSSGNLVVAPGTAYPDAYNQVLIGSDYDLVSGRNFTVVLGAGFTVEPSYFDTVIISADGGSAVSSGPTLLSTIVDGLTASVLARDADEE